MDIRRLSEVTPRPRHVAVGDFDGVHIGHQAVIAGSESVLTFEPHPLSVLRPLTAPKLLTSFALKAQLLEGLGVEELVVVHFDEAFASQSPQAFIDDVLVSALGATRVAVGANFRFGHHVRGTASLLSADPRFETDVVGLIQHDGHTVSSSRIRRLVGEGEVRDAGALLGRPFRICGEVVTGDRRGRELGFPTANLVPDPDLACPADGVYACRVGGRPAAVNVGVRPTFDDGQGRLIEAFLLDFDGDLYGRTLAIDFIERLRGEERFDSVTALVGQMDRDVLRTRELLA